MNPSYKPPPPISDRQKETMIRLYLSHRLENGPRRLAKRFNISLKRVNAIIRLKLLEKFFERKVSRSSSLSQTACRIATFRLHDAFFD